MYPDTNANTFCQNKWLWAVQVLAGILLQQSCQRGKSCYQPFTNFVFTQQSAHTQKLAHWCRQEDFEFKAKHMFKCFAKLVPT